MGAERHADGALVGLDALPRPTPLRAAVPPDAVEAMAARERRTRRALVAADAAGVALALLVALVLVGSPDVRPLALPAGVLVAKALGLYDRDELVLHRSTLDELPRLTSYAALSTLLAWLADAALVAGHLDRLQVLAFLATLLTATAVGRWLARRWAIRTMPPQRALVVGDAVAYERLVTPLVGRRGVELLGPVPLDEVIWDFDVLRRRARELGAQRLVIAPPTVGQHEDVLNLIRAAKLTGLRVSLVPSLLEVVGSSVEFDDLGGTTVLGLKRFGLTRSAHHLKRSLDLVGAGLLLLAFAPTMLVIALLIRRDSPGGALYRQTRVGRDGRRFEIVKFRTMVDGAHAMRAGLAEQNEAVGLFKMAEDPRVTRVGRLLRRTSLDELPQLLNVLRGEMSLVGPRPLVVDEDERVTGLDRRRLVLTPGMTGPWQVAGSARVPLHEMVKMDLIYAAGWTLWTDVKILLRTVPYMLARRGQ